MHFHIASSNTGLLSVANISVTNVGNLYTVTYFGNPNQTGTATISLTANDGYGDSVSFSFPVSITSSGTCSVLPITWLSFSGILQNGKTILNWTLAKEQNNKEFIIERSNDGIQWTKLFTVLSKGNTSSQSYYNASDTKPVTGINFYRIKQVDHDGRFTYSTILKIEVAKDGTSFIVHPNPANDILNYELLNSGNEVNILFKLYSTECKLLKQLHVNNKYGSFSVKDLPAGIYLLTITNNMGKVENKRIVLQR